jgi:hypothetical protein
VTIPVADGWAGNSINTVAFRRHSITTFGNKQYTVFYDTGGHAIVAKRMLSSDH